MKKLKNIFLCGFIILSTIFIGCEMNINTNTIKYCGTSEEIIKLQNIVDKASQYEYGKHIVDILNELNVVLKFDSNLENAAKYSFTLNTITFKNDKNMLNIFIHEGTHAIQDYNDYQEKSIYTNYDEYIILKLLGEFDAYIASVAYDKMDEDYVASDYLVESILNQIDYKTYIEYYSKQGLYIDVYDVDELKGLLEQDYISYDVDYVIGAIKSKISLTK